MSGKRAKPKGASGAPGLDETTDSSTPAAVTSVTSTDLLDRPEPAVRPSGTSAAAVLPGSARAGGRNAARAERRRRDRRRRLIAAGTVAVLLLGFAVWFVANRVGGSTAPPPPVTGRTQQTVLLEIGDGTATGVALLASDPAAGDGAVVLVPSSLSIDVAGYGRMTLGTAAALPVANAASHGLADTLGVKVDGTWHLSGKGLAAMVDGVGGVTVDVDTDVTGPGPSKGSTVVLIPAGSQTLDGASAAVFASFLGAGEPEQSRLARLDAVLSALLKGLPADPGQVTLLLGTLGAGSTSSVPDQLPAFLAGLRGAELDTAVAHRTLPVRSLDAGGATPAIGVDSEAGDALVTDLLAGSRASQRPGGAVRVLVQNGVGTPGLGSSARDRLVAQGFTYVAGGNAASFGAAKSVVLITDASAATQAEGVAIAKALGLPAGDVRLTTQGQSIADVVVVLGRDYKP